MANEKIKEKKTRNFLRITDSEKNKIITEAIKYPQKISGKQIYETSDGHKLKIEFSAKTELKVLSSKESSFEYLRVFPTISIAQGKKNPKTWLIFEKEKGYLDSIRERDIKTAWIALSAILKQIKKQKRCVLHNDKNSITGKE